VVCDGDDMLTETKRNAIAKAGKKGAERTMGLTLEAQLEPVYARLEELGAVPEDQVTPELAAEMAALADQIKAIAGGHVESGDQYWKPQENETAVVIMEGVELREDSFNPGKSARLYRVTKAGKSVLLGETFALRGLSRYQQGARVIIRSLGKERIDGGRTVHRFELLPPPGPKAILPVIYDWQAASVEVLKSDAPF